MESSRNIQAALGLCIAMAAVPMVAHADPAPLDAAGAEVENANKDAVTITVKQTVPRVDYVSNVVYKQINTPNSHQSLVLNLLPVSISTAPLICRPSERARARTLRKAMILLPPPRKCW